MGFRRAKVLDSPALYLAVQDKCLLGARRKEAEQVPPEVGQVRDSGYVTPANSQRPIEVRVEVETTGINLLIRHLADEETPLAVARLYHLSDLSEEELAQFRRAWPDIPLERRRRALGFLIDIAESNLEVDLEPVFRTCIRDADKEVRARAVEGLWECEDEDLIEPLLSMAQNDSAVLVRAVAVSALGRFVLLGELGRLSPQRQMAIEEILLALVRSSGECVEVRQRAVEALAYSSRNEVPGIIESAYYHQDRRMRVAAVFAMGRNLDARWQPLLLDELRSHDSELCYEAARACGELELISAVPRLAELLDDPDREIQEVSIWALGQIGGPTARQVLQAHYEAIDQEDEALREAIEDALGEVALASGAVQFPLYEYKVDAEPETSGWAEDWISGVIGKRPDDKAEDTLLDGFNDVP